MCHRLGIENPGDGRRRDQNQPADEKLVAWKSTVAAYADSRRPRHLLGLEEASDLTGAHRKLVTNGHAAALPGAGDVVADGQLFDWVQRVNRGAGNRWTFDYLEQLRTVRRGHVLCYRGLEARRWLGRSCSLHHFVQLGPGIAPIDYWLSEAGRAQFSQMLLPEFRLRAAPARHTLPRRRWTSCSGTSRAGMMTGRAPAEAGVIGNAGIPRLAQGVPNIGEWFAAHSDYECLYAGKWHLPGTFQTQIPGFEVLASGLMGHGNVSDTAAAEASAAYLLNRRRDRPFLMIVCLLQPHDICEWLRANLADAPLAYPEIADQLPPLPDNFGIPAGEPDSLQAMRQRDEPAQGRWSQLHWRYYQYCYYRYVEQVDGQVALVLRALAASGEKENTLVVFNSDHGEGMGHHQMVRKESPYDESSRVPLVLTWPGRVPAGEVRDAGPISGLDVFPTFCDAARIPLPPHCRGRSLLRADADAPDRTVVCDIPAGRGYLVRDRRFKWIVYRGDSREMLFDCEADPGERENLISNPAYAADRLRLQAALRDWLVGLITAAPPSRAERLPDGGA